MTSLPTTSRWLREFLGHLSLNLPPGECAPSTSGFDFGRIGPARRNTGGPEGLPLPPVPVAAGRGDFLTPSLTAVRGEPNCHHKYPLNNDKRFSPAASKRPGIGCSVLCRRGVHSGVSIVPVRPFADDSTHSRLHKRPSPYNISARS
jgi:hypothetical protein